MLVVIRDALLGAVLGQGRIIPVWMQGSEGNKR